MEHFLLVLYKCSKCDNNYMWNQDKPIRPDLMGSRLTIIWNKCQYSYYMSHNKSFRAYPVLVSPGAKDKIKVEHTVCSAYTVYMSDRLRSDCRDLQVLSYITPELASLFCFYLLLWAIAGQQNRQCSRAWCKINVSAASQLHQWK